MTTIDRRDKVDANKRAQTIRDGLIGMVDAMDAIAEAYQRRDWKTLGYKSWQEYCQGEFGGRLRLTQDQRQQAAIAFKGAGMSKRAIASALGITHPTVSKALGSGKNLPVSPDEPTVKTDAEVADEVARATAVFDAKNSGDVGSSPTGVPGDTAVDSDRASADGGQGDSDLPTTPPAGDGPVDRGPVPGNPQDGTTPDPSSTSNLIEGQTPFPPAGSVLSPAVSGVAAAGDEAAGEDSGQSSSADPASAFLAFVEGFAERLALVDADVVGPLLTEEQLGRLDRAADELGYVVGLLRRWAEKP